MVRPEIEAVTPLATSKTPLVPPPLTLNWLAPGPSIVTESEVLVRSSTPCERVIVAGVVRVKSIVLGVVATSACSTAHRRVPMVGCPFVSVSAGLVTVKVASNRRSSRTVRTGRHRQRARPADPLATPPRPPIPPLVASHGEPLSRWWNSA